MKTLTLLHTIIITMFALMALVSRVTNCMTGYTSCWISGLVQVNVPPQRPVFVMFFLMLLGDNKTGNITLRCVHETTVALKK